MMMKKIHVVLFLLWIMSATEAKTMQSGTFGAEVDMSANVEVPFIATEAFSWTLLIVPMVSCIALAIAVDYFCGIVRQWGCWVLLIMTLVAICSLYLFCLNGDIVRNQNAILVQQFVSYTRVVEFPCTALTCNCTTTTAAVAAAAYNVLPCALVTANDTTCNNGHQCCHSSTSCLQYSRNGVCINTRKVCTVHVENQFCHVQHLTCINMTAQSQIDSGDNNRTTLYRKTHRTLCKSNDTRCVSDFNSTYMQTPPSTFYTLPWDYSAHYATIGTVDDGAITMLASLGVVVMVIVYVFYKTERVLRRLHANRNPRLELAPIQLEHVQFTLQVQQRQQQQQQQLRNFSLIIVGKEEEEEKQTLGGDCSELAATA